MTYYVLSALLLRVVETNVRSQRTLMSVKIQFVMWLPAKLVSIVTCNDYKCRCFEIKFSREARGFDDVFYSLWPLVTFTNCGVLIFNVIEAGLVLKSRMSHMVGDPAWLVWKKTCSVSNWMLNRTITNAVVTSEIKLFQTFVDVRLKWLYFSAWKLAWNYFKIILEAYCSSWIFYNVFNVTEIFLE